MKEKTAKKKAVSKAGEIKVYTLSVIYRLDDEVNSYIYQAITKKGAFLKAIEDMKQLIKEDNDLNESGNTLSLYPNSKNFIMGEEDCVDQFEHYYSQFSEMTYINDTNYHLTITTIKDSKLTYTVEG